MVTEAQAEAAREALKQSDPLPPLDGPAPAFIGSCLEVGSGAWVLELERADLRGNPYGMSGWEFRLTHVDLAGVRASIAPSTAHEAGAGGRAGFCQGMRCHDVPPVMTAIDFLHDGEPEIALATVSDTDERLTEAYVRSYAFERGKVERWAPARGLDADEARDVDGWVDLIVHVPYERENILCEQGNTEWLRGPALLAHGAPGGTFVRDDAAAIAFAKRDCPSAPTGTFAAGARPRDDVACARLWGVPEATVLGWITKACGPASTKPPECGDPCAAQRPLMAAWAAVRPPSRSSRVCAQFAASKIDFTYAFTSAGA